MTVDDEQDSGGRKRDAAATRDAILAAAKRAFTAMSFDAAGLREIAAEAGVNAALVNRYFGSKEALFIEVMTTYDGLAPLFDGPREEFGARVARHMSIKDYSGQDLDPTIAMLRSISSPTVGPALRALVRKGMVDAIAGWLEGDHAEERAALIGAAIAGFDFIRRVVGVDALSGDAGGRAEALFAATIQAYVDAD